MTDITFDGFLKSSAVLSPCGLYRYQLHRVFGSKDKELLWLMLNPSTADDRNDDPTIRKCIGFSKRLGYSRLAVGNLFAYRATDPDELRKASLSGIDIVGPRNHEQIRLMLDKADAVVLAWGGNGARWTRAVYDVINLVRLSNKPCLTLGPCKDGSPRHPLMVGYDFGLASLRAGAAVV